MSKIGCFLFENRRISLSNLTPNPLPRFQSTPIFLCLGPSFYFSFLFLFYMLEFRQQFLRRRHRKGKYVKVVDEKIMVENVGIVKSEKGFVGVEIG